MVTNCEIKVHQVLHDSLETVALKTSSLADQSQNKGNKDQKQETANLSSGKNSYKVDGLYQ